MATADFNLGTTCPSTARKYLSLRIAVLATTVALAGCSSQPETADIQKDLAEAYACPILELSEVKKVDGAANGKSYDVTFTHTMSIKGGAEAAAKLFAEWSHLAGQQLPAKMALEQAQATGNVAAITQARSSHVFEGLNSSSPLLATRPAAARRMFAYRTPGGRLKPVRMSRSRRPSRGASMVRMTAS